ncbi:hypothetical protein [Alicyclobacillus sp.]|uniref:hypothetical protein n=1 Tax=Alicyclobacillus sp. TaxID=61169 RepID=UPI0025BB9252|nr:hypothetical protein [Alicyclobacillus sp.]MCL6515662.1 hypothetical protein [Alicyclobacillus sp.]
MRKSVETNGSRWRTRLCPAGGGRWIVTLAAVAGLAALEGCTPATQPSDRPNAAQAVPLGPEAWRTVLNAAQAGESVKQYMIKLDVQSQQGSLRSSYAAYGAVNRPDRLSIDILNQGTDLYFYQQGQSAYFRQDGHWSPTPAIADVDAYQSYVRTIQQAMAHAAPLGKLPRVYVNDEYCDVYRTTMSGQDLWPGGVTAGDAALVWPVNPGQMGAVQMTFYIGERTHVLRRVDAQSVGTVREIGTVQVDASTVFFDLDAPVARITLPKDLVRQLENVN